MKPDPTHRAAQRTGVIFLEIAAELIPRAWRANDLSVRLFQGARGTVTYRGEFVVDQEDPWYEADAPETNDGPLRKVIVFRLAPVDAEPKAPATKLGRLLESHPNPVDVLPIERNETEKTFVNPNREQYEAERKESKLVTAFAGYLTVIRPPPLAPPW